jgi:hypothetical protein
MIMDLRTAFIEEVDAITELIRGMARVEMGIHIIRFSSIGEKVREVIFYKFYPS